MRDELTCWDSVREKGFTGQEAALAMVGEPDTDDPAKLRKAMRPLELMRASYEGTRRWFSSAPVDADTPPRGLLVSDEMQLAQGLTDEALVEVAGDFRFLTWLCTPMADFDRQHFSRDVLTRWMEEVGASSLYLFAGPQTSVAPVEDSVSNAPDQKEQRQDSRLQACIDAGLPMSTKTALLRLPDGVGAVADRLGLTRQAFSADVKAALKRRASAIREGSTVHRA
jgi:hypothetical protein